HARAALGRRARPRAADTAARDRSGDGGPARHRARPGRGHAGPRPDGRGPAQRDAPDDPACGAGDGRGSERDEGIRAMTDLYQSQRAMRNMRRAALQRGVVAVLDVGTSKIACLVLKFENAEEGPDDGLGALAGQSQLRVIGAAPTRPRGARFGEVDAMAETERAIRTAVQAAQKMAQTRVDHVIACFAGARPRSYGLAGEIELSDGQVSEQDVARVLAACEVPDYGPGREALHAHPVNFAIDHRTGFGDPRGHVGNRLAADMHLLTIDTAAVQNLI